MRSVLPQSASTWRWKYGESRPERRQILPPRKGPQELLPVFGLTRTGKLQILVNNSEPFDNLRDLVSFASSLDIHEPNAIGRIAEFAGSLMSATAANDLQRRLETILAGRSRKEVSALEQAALNFAAAPSYAEVAWLLTEFNAEVGVRVHRPLVLRTSIRALKSVRSRAVRRFARPLYVRENTI